MLKTIFSQRHRSCVQFLTFNKSSRILFVLYIIYMVCVNHIVFLVFACGETLCVRNAAFMFSYVG